MSRLVDPSPRASSSDANALAVRALSRTASGDFLGALAAWRGAVEGGAAPDLLARARPVLTRVEGCGPRDGTPPPAPAAGPATPAWALAWAGDLEAARRLAELGSENADSLGLLGALDVLARRPARGIELLERAIALGGEETLALHRARALVHLGRAEDARRALAELADGESVSRRTVQALADVACGYYPPILQTGRRAAKSQGMYNGFYERALPALVGAAELDRAFRSPEALTAVLEALLDRMAGNLGRSTTFAEVEPGGGRRFVHVSVPPTPRDEAVQALNSVRHVGAAAAEAALISLRESHPRAVHPLTYLGELYLWLGRYDDAFRAFDGAGRIERARWGSIGVLAVLVFTGHTRFARAAAFHAAQSFPPLRGSTLPVYRGILRRRIGDLEGAIEDLRAAIEVKASRIGARMELCLALRAAGRRAEALEHATAIVRDGAPILVDAAETRGIDWRLEPGVLVGDDVLEAALGAMRGNRSSSLVTWIDRAGGLRVLEPRWALEQDAKRALEPPRRAPGR